MNKEIREISLPPENLLFNPITLGSSRPTPFIFKVSYVNAGKFRFTADAFAVVQEDTKTKKRHVLILSDGRIMSLEEFDVYVKNGPFIVATFAPPPDPAPDEQPGPPVVGSKNSKNITLDVHSGPIQQTGGFKTK